MSSPTHGIKEALHTLAQGPVAAQAIARHVLEVVDLPLNQPSIGRIGRKIWLEDTFP